MFFLNHQINTFSLQNQYLCSFSNSGMIVNYCSYAHNYPDHLSFRYQRIYSQRCLKQLENYLDFYLPLINKSQSAQNRQDLHSQFHLNIAIHLSHDYLTNMGSHSSPQILQRPQLIFFHSFGYNIKLYYDAIGQILDYLELGNCLRIIFSQKDKKSCNMEFILSEINQQVLQVYYYFSKKYYSMGGLFSVFRSSNFSNESNSKQISQPLFPSDKIENKKPQTNQQLKNSSSIIFNNINQGSKHKIKFKQLSKHFLILLKENSRSREQLRDKELQIDKIISTNQKKQEQFREYLLQKIIQNQNLKNQLLDLKMENIKLKFQLKIYGQEIKILLDSSKCFNNLDHKMNYIA